MLAPEFAVVDALEAFRETPNSNLLALADSLVETKPNLSSVKDLAEQVGLDGDLDALSDHRRRWRGRVVGPEDVRYAHRLAREMSEMPAGMRFTELAVSREARHR